MKITPKERQLKYMDWEFGVFFHFGIRTFNHAHRDWDEEGMKASSFYPTALDCNQWLTEIKCAGAKYAVMTTKHHDGFAFGRRKRRNILFRRRNGRAERAMLCTNSRMPATKPELPAGFIIRPLNGTRAAGFQAKTKITAGM